MLHVTGLVGVSSHDTIERNKAKNGWYFTFFVVSQEPGGKTHKYRASMWVPDNKEREWRNKITRGSVFYIDHAFWRMFQSDKSQHPLPTLELKINGFHKMTNPYWHERQTDG